MTTYPAELLRTLTWTVIPAQPGTYIEWNAKWCTEGSIPVHAWLIRLDIVAEDPEHSSRPVDTSCAIGKPMILNADGELQDAEYADLEGKPGAVIEPPVFFANHPS